jgi:hypothetical protein
VAKKPVLPFRKATFAEIIADSHALHELEKHREVNAAERSGR